MLLKQLFFVWFWLKLSTMYDAGSNFVCLFSFWLVCQLVSRCGIGLFISVAPISTLEAPRGPDGAHITFVYKSHTPPHLTTQSEIFCWNLWNKKNVFSPCCQMTAGKPRFGHCNQVGFICTSGKILVLYAPLERFWFYMHHWKDLPSPCDTLSLSRYCDIPQLYSVSTQVPFMLRFWYFSMIHIMFNFLYLLVQIPSWIALKYKYSKFGALWFDAKIGRTFLGLSSRLSALARECDTCLTCQELGGRGGAPEEFSSPGTAWW